MHIVYIGGYGRSGSSILDRELSSSLGALSGGELCNLFEWSATDRRCTCGEGFHRCDVWGPIIESVTSRTGLDVGEVARRVADAEFNRNSIYVGDWQQVWSIVIENLSQAGIQAIVDSSKNARLRRRHELLIDLPAVGSVEYIHLYRELSAVVLSAKSGRNQNLELGVDIPDRFPISRTIASWLVANLYSRLSGPASSSYRIIYYRDLKDSNISHVASDLSAPWGVGYGEPVTEHSVAGNRALRRSAVGFTSVKTRRESKPPVRIRLLCFIPGLLIRLMLRFSARTSVV